MFKPLIVSLVCFSFIFSDLQYVHAQDFSINQLPVPGTMIGESVPFTPLALKGVVVNPQKPLEFQFIVDTGRGPQDTAAIKDQANQLVKYFLAGLTIPEGDLWVNLSPYEKNRMVPQALGQTDLGRDLLAQDYILKQLTASLIYPEKDLGKEFWNRVYAKAQQQFGTTNIPVNTFNKVWILPNQAQVFENANAAYVTKATLKVMLDEDYLALQNHTLVRNDMGSIGANIVRQIILPEIEKEVNTGKNFAPLRQIYQALILAKWYKETIQNGLLDTIYTNKNKVAGVNLNDPAVKEEIYQRYLQAYKKGAFNYIKDDAISNGQIMPRKYFSGGITEIEPRFIDRSGKRTDVKGDGAMISLTISLVATGAAVLGGIIYSNRYKIYSISRLLGLLKVAENRHAYQEYNAISDELYRRGHLGGSYIYKDVEIESYHEIGGVEGPSRGEWYVNPEIIPAKYEWQKHRRFDSAMLAQVILNDLQYRDAIPADVKIDDIVILGNDELDVFRHALGLWREHRDSRIVILGGKGRLTQPLIAKASQAGFQIEDDSSEAVIIEQIIKDMIDEEPQFADLKASSIRPVFELEKDSTTTPENIENYKAKIDDKLKQYGKGNSYHIVYLQSPHQQLRAKATVDKYLKSEIDDGRVIAFSDTAKYDRPQENHALDALGEAIRMIIYSDHGNGTIANENDHLPDAFWQNVIDFYDTFSGPQRIQNASFLMALIKGTKKSGQELSIDDLIKGFPENNKQKAFLELIQADSAMLALQYFSAGVTATAIPLAALIYYRWSHYTVNGIGSRTDKWKRLTESATNDFKRYLSKSDYLELLKFLSYDNPTIRTFIIERMGQLAGDRRAIHSLVTYLSSRNRAVRQFAKSELGKLDIDPTILDLLAQLGEAESNEDFKTYNNVSKELQKLGHSEGDFIYAQFPHMVPDEEMDGLVQDGYQWEKVRRQEYLARMLMNMDMDVPFEEINNMMSKYNVTRSKFIQALLYFLTTSPLERDQVRAVLLIFNLYKGTEEESRTDDLKAAYKRANKKIDILNGEPVEDINQAQSALLRSHDQLGGIDLDSIKVKRTGKVIKVFFDQAQLNELMQGGFEGFTPVITNMTRISSPFQFFNDKGINSI